MGVEGEPEEIGTEGVIGRASTKGGGDSGFGSGGARGGGAKGGGSFVGTGGGRIIFDNAANLSSSSISSLALGTISERNSRSSEDRAMEFRGLGFDGLFDLENRPKNRETAEGACTSSSGSEGAELAAALGVAEISAIADIVAEGVASVSLTDIEDDTGFVVIGGVRLASILGRGEAVLDRGETPIGVCDRTGEDEPEVGALVVDLLPKNDRRPPAAFFLVSFIDCC